MTKILLNENEHTLPLGILVSKYVKTLTMIFRNSLHIAFLPTKLIKTPVPLSFGFVCSLVVYTHTHTAFYIYVWHAVIVILHPSKSEHPVV